MYRFKPNRLARDFFHLTRGVYDSTRNEQPTEFLTRIMGQSFADEYAVAQDFFCNNTIAIVSGVFGDQHVKLGTIERI